MGGAKSRAITEVKHLELKQGTLNFADIEG